MRAPGGCVLIRSLSHSSRLGVVAAAVNAAGAKFQTGSTALHLAAASGRTDCVRLLLEVGADKEAQNKVCTIMHGI
jgi:hypothetical protein